MPFTKVVMLYHYRPAPSQIHVKLQGLVEFKPSKRALWSSVQCSHKGWAYAQHNSIPWLLFWSQPWVLGFWSRIEYSHPLEIPLCPFSSRSSPFPASYKGEEMLVQVNSLFLSCKSLIFLCFSVFCMQWQVLLPPTFWNRPASSSQKIGVLEYQTRISVHTGDFYFRL